MKERDISGAMVGHLLNMPNVPWVVMENKDLPAGTQRPYLKLQHIRVSRRNKDVQGGTAGIVSRGFLQVGVVWDLDVYADDAEEMADRIAAYFPKGLRITAPTGVVTIMDAPDILSATRDGPNWMVPVQINREGS